MSYQLRISEIFFSLQGETSYVGLPTVFVRLTGCPLRCAYCDTTYAFKGGEWMDAEQIIEKIAAYKTRYVCVTGGEPLAQKDCRKLLKDLVEQHYHVSLETSGSIAIGGVDQRVKRVVDLKTPASGEMDKNLFDNIEYLTEHDEVKFVICDREDYEWSKQQLAAYQIDRRCPVLFSAAEGMLDSSELADWIVADNVPVRMQIQLHKYLWGGGEGR